MRIKQLLLSVLVLSNFMIGASAIVLSVSPSSLLADTGDECTLTGSFLGLPAWYKYLNAVEDSTGRCSPVLTNDQEDDIGQEEVNSALPIGLAILEGMLRISGIVAVVMIFVAGFKYITSQGVPDAAAGARKTALNALIGLVIVIMATTLVSFIGNSLLDSAPVGGTPALAQAPPQNGTGPR